MENERDSQAIYFKDLLFSAFYKWRAVLLAAVVFAGLLGGYKYLKNQDIRNTAPSETTVESIARVEQEIVMAEEKLANQEAYLCQSLLMQLDPYSVYEAGADVYVKTDYQILPEMTYQNVDITKTLLRTYETLLRDQAVLNEVAQQTGLDAKYLWELIKVEVPNDDSRSLCIRVKYADAYGAQGIVDALVASLNAAKPQIESSHGVHQMHIVTYHTDVRTDPALADAQKTEAQRSDALLAEVEALQKECNALKAVQTGKSPVLFAAIGAVLGAFLAAGIACVQHIATDRVYSERKLKDRTNIKVLGCIPSGRKRNGVDKLLRKLEGRVGADAQTLVPVLAASIANCCKNGEKLLIAGAAQTPVRELLCRTLAQNGINVQDKGSLLCDHEAIKTLSYCDAVLLIEQCGCSKYTGVMRQMERICDRDKRLIGCVLIDG